jgi:hypothetical protein
MRDSIWKLLILLGCRREGTPGGGLGENAKAKKIIFPFLQILTTCPAVCRSGAENLHMRSAFQKSSGLPL